jgi:hypothetical protein
MRREEKKERHGSTGQTLERKKEEEKRNWEQRELGREENTSNPSKTIEEIRYGMPCRSQTSRYYRTDENGVVLADQYLCQFVAVKASFEYAVEED